jgi:PAS domain S-box-containing protein
MMNMITKTELAKENARLQRRVAKLEKQLAICLKEKGEERFRSLFEHAPMAYQSLDEQGCFLDVNPAYCKLVGYQADELLGTSFGDLWSPATRSAFPQMFDQLKCDNHVQTELQLVHQDGTPIAVVLNGSVQRDAKGKFIRTHCILHDITEGKRAEAQLAKLAERLELATRAAGIGIWDWDIQNNVLVWDDRMYELYGRRKDEFGGAYEAWLHGVHPDDREASNQISARAVRGEAEYDTEFRVLWSDGSTHWLKANGQVFRDEGGTLIRMIGVNYDITERKRAEEDLERFFNMLPDMACIASTDGYFKKLNREWKRTLGFSSEELLAKPLAEFIHPEDRAATFNEIEHQVQGGATIRFSNRYQSKDGSYRWLEWNAMPSPDGIHLYAAARDITDRKHAEGALQESLAKLEKLIDLLPVGISVLDRERKVVKENAALGRILGISAEGLVRGDYRNRQYLGSDGTPMPANAFASARVMQGESSALNVETGVVKEDGNIVWTSVSAVAVPFSDWSTIIVTTDITERKHAEQALRESEQKYTTLFEKSTVPTVVLKMPKVVIADANEACERLTGFTRQEMLGKTLVTLGLLRKEEQKETLSQFERQGALTSNELRLFNKSGEERIVLSNTMPVTIGGQMYAITTMQDITERKQAEAALTASENRFRVLIEHSSDGIVLISSKGQVIYESPSATRLIGFAPEERLGKSVFENIYPDDLAMARAKFAQIANQPGGMIQVEYRAVRKDGSLWWTEVVATNLLNEPGVQGIVVNFRDITERKQAEEKLRESEERLELVMEGSQLGYWDWNIETNSVHRNVRWAEMLGYTLEEIEYSVKQWTDLHHPDDRETAWKSIQDHLAGKTPAHRIEYRMRAKDGTYKWILDQARVVKRDTQGKPLRMSGTHTDITERKHAEEQLRASEEKYRGLLESLDSVLVVLDYEGRHLYINDMGARLFNATPTEMIGKKLDDVFPPQYVVQELEAIRQVFQTDCPIMREVQVFVQGAPRWYRAAYQPIHDGQSQVTQVLVNATDIHNLKSTQQELAELNRTLEERIKQATAEIQDLYDNAPAGYHSLDTNGCFIQINQTELNWLGYSRDEVIGRPFSDFATAGLATFKQNFEGFKQRGWLRDLEMEFLRKDGTTFQALVNATAIKDNNGNYVSSRSTVIDISERKLAEEAMQRANVEMERALRMKDEFMANMSHELRTPLNAILGLSETLGEQVLGPLNDRQLNSVQIVEASGRHLLALINDILDLSKIEAGAVSLDMALVDVPSICQASLLFVKQSAFKKGIKLTSQLDTQVKWITADERRLKQMLVNLLTNAVKFTPTGGQVELGVIGDIEKRTTRFCVRDTGIGISVEDQAHLFKPFVQVDSSLTRAYEGTGLGLALVARMAEMHGGSVSLESQVGKGSCFTIEVPWSEAMQVRDGVQPEAITTTTETTEPPKSTASSPLILIAEDNEANILTLSMYLESKEYRVAIARHGGEAFDMARTEHPALILMDIQMPVLDGLEVTRRLRREPDSQVANIPVIALTALAMVGDRERALAAGANEYLSKPVNLKELVKLIDRYIERK